MFPKKNDYDLVIVGGGLSGLAAAVAAGEKKLATLVLEKGRTLGGDGNYVEGAMGVDSTMQKDAGISIDKTELLQDELTYSHYEASAPHLKKLIDASGATIDLVVAVAGGHTKAAAIEAYFKLPPAPTFLVTDEGTADTILKK